MINKGTPYVIEFNVRLGDPEAQVLLPLVQSSLLEMMVDAVDGNLESHEISLSSDYAVTVVLAADGYPDKYSLDIVNYPNPFNSQTNFKYDVSIDAFVSLVIYDVKGSPIKTLVSEYQMSGPMIVPWNGTTDSGKIISSCVYLYRFNYGQRSQTKKMIFLK